MDVDMQLYWQAYNELVSNEDILGSSPNPLSIYKSEIIDGPIIDIGCGQSALLLSYSKTERELYAVDNDSYQLVSLKSRMIELNNEDKNQWYFLDLTFPDQDIPDKVYSVVSIVNFLHFFDISGATNVVARILSKTSVGSLIYIIVHSTKHYTNDPSDPENNDYFKHFYSLQDLDSLFDHTLFERIYTSSVERVPAKHDELVYNRWIDKYLERRGVTDEETKRRVKEENNEGRAEAYLEIIYRRTQLNIDDKPSDM